MNQEFIRRINTEETKLGKLGPTKYLETNRRINAQEEDSIINGFPVEKSYY